MVRTANQGHTEGVGNIADGVRNRCGAAACEKQRHRLRRGLRDDEGAGITRRAKRAAVDEYLVDIRNSELFPLTAAVLVFDEDVRADRGDGCTGQAGRAAALNDARAHGRCGFGGRRHSHLQDVSRGLHSTGNNLSESRVDVRGPEGLGGREVCDGI